MKFTVRFIPQGQDKIEDGTTVYRYKLEPNISGRKIDAKLKGNLLQSSKFTSNNGFCLSQVSYECSHLFIELDGVGGGSGVILVYDQVRPGDPFIRSAPRYSHPSNLNQPPFVGDIRFATTVPRLVGLTEQQAREKLRQSKLKWNIERFVAAPTGNLAGKVKETRPQEGVEVEIGATVSLSLYSGKAKVPRVIGMSSKEAKRILENAGFTHSVKLGRAATRKELVA